MGGCVASVESGPGAVSVSSGNLFKRDDIWCHQNRTKGRPDRFHEAAGVASCCVGGDPCRVLFGMVGLDC